MCKMSHCNKCILFDGRLQRDLYMWFSNSPDGPSIKFNVESSKLFEYGANENNIFLIICYYSIYKC